MTYVEMHSVVDGILTRFSDVVMVFEWNKIYARTSTCLQLDEQGILVLMFQLNKSCTRTQEVDPEKNEAWTAFRPGLQAIENWLVTLELRA